MEVEIIDTPYSDRSCKNCAHCVKTEMRYCLHNHAFVAKNKWCSDWKWYELWVQIFGDLLRHLKKSFMYLMIGIERLSYAPNVIK